jgi:HSP20 family protein
MLSIRKNENNIPALPGLFEDFLSRELFNWENSNFSSTSTTVPSINIKETNENYEVEVAAPGLDKKDFNVSLDNNMLTISCTKSVSKEDKGENENYTRREFSYQSFQRSFELPNVVDEDRINAHYDNGLLHLTIPKKEEAKQKEPKLIEIK